MRKLDFTPYAENTELCFSASALAKMEWLVEHCNSEIGWNGLVRRPEENIYEVYDILVYPQMVTSSTVKTDDEEYAKWVEGLDNDTLEHMRFNGHSHVNMPVYPSFTDMTFRQGICTQLDKDDFYIFAILNKRDRINAEIYEVAKKIVYETNDIVFRVTDLEEYKELKKTGAVNAEMQNEIDTKVRYEVLKKSEMQKLNDIFKGVHYGHS